MTHLTFEQISELAERREPSAESREPRAESQSHLSQCEQCSETLRRVRELVSAAQALPRDIAPPPEVWTALRTRVAREPRHASRWLRTGWLAMAAAIVLVVGTAILLPRNAGKAKASKLGGPPPVATIPGPDASAQPVILASVDLNYTATLEQLRQTLDTQRGTLSPSTVRVLEHSLALIDTAIAEARQALASDPSNQALVQILSANYERKVELLQRVTELSPSS